jgi:hypothetical protein
MAYTLNADDVRNPTYYEKRAGWPEADDAWFRGRGNMPEGTTKKDAVVGIMQFTKLNFVTGFDLTCGEYYRLREDVVNLLLVEKLFKHNFKNPETNWALYEIYGEVERHTLLRNKIERCPPYWAHYMITQFVTKDVAEWIDYQKHLLDPENITGTLERSSNWTWGPNTTARDPGGWNGIYQYQHMDLLVKLDTPNDPVMFKIPLYKVAGLEESRTITPVDMELGSLSFELLEDEIKKKYLEYEEMGLRVTFSMPDDVGSPIAIEDNHSLQSAVMILRKPGEDHIPFLLTRKSLLVVSRDQTGTRYRV